jgi:hypothetical protein
LLTKASERLPLGLAFLNLVRWLREYFVSWGVLSLIYSWTVTLVLQPILEQFFKHEIRFWPLWAATCALLLIPSILEYLPWPAVSFQWKRIGFMSQGIFRERVWSRSPWSMVRLYLRHELRRGATWFTLILAVCLGAAMPRPKSAIWVLIALLPCQRALYSIHRWRSLVLIGSAREGARQLYLAFGISQLIQLAIAWLALGLAAGPDWGMQTWLKLGAGSLGGVIAASMVVLEGDSGRPWLVNFISLAAGALGGYVCFAAPWALLLILYFYFKMQTSVAQRLHSVEHLDEDRFIS